MSYTKTFPDGVLYPLRYQKNFTKWNFSTAVPLVGSRSGSKVENYKEKIRLGQQAGSVFTSNRFKMMSVETKTVSLAASVIENPSAGVQTQSISGLNGVHTIPAHNVIAVGESEAIALTKLYKKMNSQITHVNMPAAFLEFGDVIRQFGSPLRSVLRLTEAHFNRLYLQKRGIHALRYNKKDYLRAAADSYLEYAFGLQPLINDTKKVAEALARLTFETTGEIPLPTRLVGRGSVEKATNSTGLTVFPNSWFRVRNTRKLVTTSKSQYVCGFSSFPRADLGSYDRLTQLLGFRPESWVPAVWEAVPWSWLIDYFSNVQDLLSSLEASTIKPTWIVKTNTQVSDAFTMCSVDGGLTVLGAKSAGFNRCIVQGSLMGQFHCRRTTVQRTLPDSLGLPTIQFQVPTDLRQMLAMGSVAITKLRKSQPAISLETSYRNLR